MHFLRLFGSVLARRAKCTRQSQVGSAFGGRTAPPDALRHITERIVSFTMLRNIRNIAPVWRSSRLSSHRRTRHDKTVPSVSCLAWRCEVASRCIELRTAFGALTLLVERQEGHPACRKTEWWCVGVVICLERGADLHMAQRMPLPLTISCFSKIQGPNLQNIVRQSCDNLTIMPKLRSTYDGRLIYKTSYEGRKAFLRYDSLAKL